jgi:hypothetical protein
MTINTPKIFEADEDDDTKWCICGHHIVSHVEAGGPCKDLFCNNSCDEFIPCTMMSARECRRRYKLLMPVIRERFVIRHSDTLKLLKIKVDAKFREAIDKCLQLEDIDIYDLRNFVVRKIMRPKNISNLTELDIYLKWPVPLYTPIKNWQELNIINVVELLPEKPGGKGNVY